MDAVTKTIFATHNFFTLSDYHFPNLAKKLNLSLHSCKLQSQFVAEIPKFTKIKMIFFFNLDTCFLTKGSPEIFSPPNCSQYIHLNDF